MTGSLSKEISQPQSLLKDPTQRMYPAIGRVSSLLRLGIQVDLEGIYFTQTILMVISRRPANLYARGPHQVMRLNTRNPLAEELLHSRVSGSYMPKLWDSETFRRYLEFSGTLGLQIAQSRSYLYTLGPKVGLIYILVWVLRSHKIKRPRSQQPSNTGPLNPCGSRKSSSPSMSSKSRSSSLMSTGGSMASSLESWELPMAWVRLLSGPWDKKIDFWGLMVL